MPELYDDDDSRMTELALIFHGKGQARDQRAGDPEGFVRLAYIAKSAIDRTFGPGNAHSAGLVDLCCAWEGHPDEGSATLSERYLLAATILRQAVRDRLAGR